MAKSNIMKRHKEELKGGDFYFSEEPPEDAAIAGMMGALMEASNHQTMLAIELTKLVVSKNTAPSMSENDIFSAFKRAIKVIGENYPLKSMLEELR